MGIHNNALIGSSGQSVGDYNLTNSLRFRSSASAYLNRTPSTGNRKTWTWSAWVKRGSSSFNTLFAARQPAPRQYIAFYNNQIYCYGTSAGSDFVECNTAAVFRDFSAWYHIVFVYDTTQATGSNRVKVYVNGVQQTLTFTTTPSQNSDGAINGNWLHYLGSQDSSTPDLDAYLTEVNFVDGQALTPSSFGETSATTGVWIPKRYSGNYGTNGFYLPFTNTASTSTLGNDFSGNGNTWTVNNISLTAGSTYDSMTDVPTLTSATAANYATFNGIGVYTNSTSNLTYSNGNLQITYNDATVQIGSSIRIPNISGKYYLEFTATYTTPSNGFVGLFIPNNAVILQQNGTIGNFGSCTITSTTGVGYSSGQIISLAIDADTKTATFRINNTVNTVIDFSVVPTGDLIDPAVWLRLSGDSFIANYGQRPFAYTPPTGFVGLNTFNLPTPTIGATALTTANEYFDVNTWTGNGTSQNITNSGSMQPDLVWLKCRSFNYRNQLVDSIRGATNTLFSDSQDIAGTYQGVTAFNANGFSLGTELGANENGQSYVGWQWKANGAGVTNTNGSITSTVSVNTTAGFSIVRYVVPSSGSTYSWGHGLPAAPQFIIIKGGYTTVTYNWDVYHVSIGPTVRLVLNSTSAKQTYSGPWNNTTPTATTVSQEINWYASGDTNIAYCWTPVAGYSAFGSYTANASTDGPFIYTGFRPRWILIKGDVAGNEWVIVDTSRDTYNVSEKLLYPNYAFAESTSVALDILSNGFKIRGSGGGVNYSSGATYIYAAFAENPFKYANAR